MNKAIKILLGIIAALVAIIVIAVVFVAFFFDANAYKSEIAAKVEQATGRSMAIGAIHVSVFPTLGLKLSNTSLGNARGFDKQTFAKVGEVDVGVRLLPLVLDRKLEVGTIYLSGLQLNLERNAAGKTNWADLAGKQPQSAEPAKTAGGGFQLTSVAIGGVHVSDSSIHYVDAQKHQDIRLDDFNLSVGALTQGKPTSFETEFKTTSSAPPVSANVQASGKLTFDLAGQHYQVQKFVLQVDAKGKTIPGGEQTVKVAGDVDYNGKAGQFRLAGGQVNVAGLKVHASLEASGLNDDKLVFSGPISVDPFDPRDTLKAIGMSDFRVHDASALKSASFEGKLSGTANAATLKDVTLKLDKTTATGSLGVTSFKVPALKFALKVDDIDVDRYMPVAKAGGKPAKKASGDSGDDTQIPVKMLDAFSANGVLSIGKLVLHGVHMADATAKIAATKGASKVVDLNAKLYGGSIASSAHITPGARPSYKTHVKLAGVDVGPLLKDATGKDVLSGRGDVAADLTTAGKTVGAVKRALDGTVSFALNNGAVKGFDLGKLLRKGKTLLDSGGSVAAASTTTSEKTDFTAISASGKIANGILTSDDLKGASPLLRLAGAGTVNLVKQTVDYTIKPTLVNTATGQGGKKMSQLEGVTIPVKVSGPFTSLSYHLDIGDALKHKATQALHKQLDKHKDEIQKKLQQGLKGLFGGH